MKKKRLKYLSLSVLFFLGLAYIKHYLNSGMRKVFSLKDIKW